MANRGLRRVVGLPRDIAGRGSSTVSFVEGRDAELKGIDGQHRLCALAR
jgi:hypothetical protein